MSSDSPLLEARGIGRRQRDGSSWLIHDVSIMIGEGDQIAVRGPTGSGKTVALRSLAMLDAIDAGEIRWRDRTLTADEIPTYRSQVIYLAQRARLFGGTVEENLQRPFSLAVHRHQGFSRERIASFLERLDRDERFLTLDSEHLSGGEMQIVALLRAIQLDPTILLLDEPTASLDAETTQQIERLVMGWMSEGQGRHAFVWVTHDVLQANRIANRQLECRGGRVLEVESIR